MWKILGCSSRWTNKNSFILPTCSSMPSALLMTNGGNIYKDSWTRESKIWIFNCLNVLIQNLSMLGVFSPSVCIIVQWIPLAIVAEEWGWGQAFSIRPLFLFLEARCEAPLGFLNGKADVENTIAGPKVLYSCNRGYSLEGASEAYCAENGTWSHPRPLCKRVCWL